MKNFIQTIVWFVSAYLLLHYYYNASILDAFLTWALFLIEFFVLAGIIVAIAYLLTIHNPLAAGIISGWVHNMRNPTRLVYIISTALLLVAFTVLQYVTLKIVFGDVATLWQAAIFILITAGAGLLGMFIYNRVTRKASLFF